MRRSSRHGAEIPVIGLGTGGLGDDCGNIVAAALAAGYRHIDTARKYGTERGVGEAIRAARVPRDEIFLSQPFRDPRAPRALRRTSMCSGSRSPMTR
jgi:diketogulonate reductase-like aldo/keto reductase